MRMAILIGTLLFVAIATANSEPNRSIRSAWPNLDWSTSVVPTDEIISSGVRRDGIPPVYAPKTEEADSAGIPGSEPVISLIVNGEARAYPLRYMTVHEIVNDVVGGAPVLVTYCPLCNAAIAFERRVEGKMTAFGVSGLLRKSDLIMWDHATESLWQQFEGRAIVGQLAGQALRRLPSRLESFEEYRRRHPSGLVLAPPTENFPYGMNPYVGYDRLHQRPFLYRGDLPRKVPPMQRVVIVSGKAWSLDQVAEAGEIVDGRVRLSVTHEQNSALHREKIVTGRRVAGVVVERRGEDGVWRDTPHDVTFAFVFHAFHPDGEWKF